jgi:hypothetical protein
VSTVGKLDKSIGRVGVLSEYVVCGGFSLSGEQEGVNAVMGADAREREAARHHEHRAAAHESCTELSVNSPVSIKNKKTQI